MTEQERLELVTTVVEDFEDDLERLEGDLEDIDDEIRQTGGGRDKIEIDVEVNDVSGAIGQIEALNASLERLDDDISIDVDHDVGGVTPDPADGGGATAMTSGGRPTLDENVISDSDVLNRQSSSLQLYKDLNERFDEIADELGRDGFDDVELATSANPPTHFEGPFGQGSGAASPQEIRDLFGFMGFEDDLEYELDDSEMTKRLRELDMTGVGGEPMVEFVTDDDLDTDRSVEEMRDAYGIDVPDLDDDRRGFDVPEVPEVQNIRKRLKKIGESLEKLRFTMGSFHQLYASLIPLLGVFVGAIPAAVVGLGALATAALGAAGALAGVGVLGGMGIMLSETGELDTQPLVRRWNSLVDSFVEAFAPLATSLASTLERAIADVEAMAGPLAAASSGLLAFRDDFEAAVSFVTSSLPSFTADLLAFSHAAMPLLKGVIQTVANTDIFGYLATQLQRAWPSLVRIGKALTEILPAIVNLSQGFLWMAGVVSFFAGVISSIINYSPLLAKALGAVAGGLLVVVSMATIATIATQGLIRSSLTLAGSLLTSVVPGLGAAYSALQGYIFNILLSTSVTYGFAHALATALSVLTLGIGAVTILAGAFSVLGDEIGGARRELEKFNAVNGSFGEMPATGGGGNTLGGGVNVYRDNSTTVINAGNPDDAARQQYASQYEQKQYVDSVFGSG